MIRELISMIPGIVLIAFVSAIAYLIYKKLKENKNYLDIEDFKPIPMDESVRKQLHDKTDKMGTKIKKGILCIGDKPMKHLDRYYKIVGKMPVMNYDIEARQFSKKTDEKNNPVVENYDFRIFRIGSEKLLKRIFGFDKSYFIINIEKIKNAHFIPSSNTFKFPFIDFIKYANTWVEDNLSMEYISNLSIIEQLEQAYTHVNSAPNKTVHLENAFAKKERLVEKMSSLEQAKYEEMKKAGDYEVTYS